MTDTAFDEALSQSAESGAVIADVDKVETQVLHESKKAESPDVEKSASSEVEQKPVEPQKEEEVLTVSAKKRINQLTAEKYAERKERERLQRELESVKQQTQQASPPQSKPAHSGAPRLEDFDYDEGKYQEALIDHRVTARMDQERKSQEDKQAQVTQAGLVNSYNQNVAKFIGGQDVDAQAFMSAQDSLPQLPPEISNFIMQSDNGAKLVYHLGNNLDVAYRIAQSDPINAAVELGLISAKLSASQGAAQVSNAPMPVKTISGSGAVVNPQDEDETAESMFRRIGTGDLK